MRDCIVFLLDIFKYNQTKTSLSSVPNQFSIPRNFKKII